MFVRVMSVCSQCNGDTDHCLISYRGGLGTSLCIMGYGTQHPHSRKEHIELYNILKFGVNQANIRRDTAIQKLKNLLRNVWNAGHNNNNNNNLFSIPIYIHGITYVISLDYVK